MGHGSSVVKEGFKARENLAKTCGDVALGHIDVVRRQPEVTRDFGGRSLLHDISFEGVDRFFVEFGLITKFGDRLPQNGSFSFRLPGGGEAAIVR